MSKFKNIATKIEKEMPDFVVNALDPIIHDGKKYPKGGWVKMADITPELQKVLDGTDPTKTGGEGGTSTELSKTEKAAKNAEAKASANDAKEAAADAGKYMDGDDVETATQFVEAAEAALTKATEAAALGEAKGAQKAVESAKTLVEGVRKRLDALTGEGAEDDDDDLIGDGGGIPQ